MAVLYAGSLLAQEPVPSDTLPADSAAAPPTDSVLDPAVGAEQEPTVDSLPIATMPILPAPADTGWVEAEVRWDRDALLSAAAITLSDLLAGVAGLHLLRFGYLGAPEALTTAGGAGAAVEVYWDGFRLDPLGASTVDLSRIELASLETVRVERALDAIRVHLTTRVADEARPYTRVEAAAGDLDTEIFTGVALIPRVLWGPLGLGVTRVETDGRGGVEGAVALNAFAHWGVTGEDWGVRVQARLDEVRRDPNHPLEGDSRRLDIVGRASAEVAPGVVLEVFGGKSELTVELPVDTLSPDPVAVDSFDVGPRTREPDPIQAGLRVGVARGPVFLEGDARWRDEGPLPKLELGMRGALSLADRVLLAGGVGHDRWSSVVGFDPATSWDARGALRVVGGLELTGAASGGELGVPHTGLGTAGVSRTALKRRRYGARLTLGPLRVAGGRVQVEVDSIVALGLGFDPRGARFSGADAQGWEAEGRVRAGGLPFRVEGWVQDWSEGATGPYLPARAWRAGLVYDHLPLASDNLHIYAGLFHSRRGAALFPVLSQPTLDGEPVAPVVLTELEGVSTLDFVLNVRVVTARLFVRWENTLLEDGQVFPERRLLRQRVITGLRWDFYN